MAAYGQVTFGPTITSSGLGSISASATIIGMLPYGSLGAPQAITSAGIGAPTNYALAGTLARTRVTIGRLFPPPNRR